MSSEKQVPHHLLTLFQRYLAEYNADEESIFTTGFSVPFETSSSRGPAEYVAWPEVEKFLKMTEQALKARNKAAEDLEKRLNAAKQQLETEMHEKIKVVKQEASAAEDSSFLATEMQAIMQEKQQLKDMLQKLERERMYLLEENKLLRRQVEADNMEVGLATSRIVEDLRSEQQRCSVLENEAMQLRARVAALERANQAQHTALLGCIEESERVRIQTEHADCMSMHKLCIGSPSAHSEWGYQLSCKSTDDSAYGGDIERGSHLSSSTPSAHRPSLGEQQSTFHTPVLISSPAQQESIR